jgi:hypothetical protein
MVAGSEEPQASSSRASAWCFHRHLGTLGNRTHISLGRDAPEFIRADRPFPPDAVLPAFGNLPVPAIQPRPAENFSVLSMRRQETSIGRAGKILIARNRQVLATLGIFVSVLFKIEILILSESVGRLRMHTVLPGLPTRLPKLPPPRLGFLVGNSREGTHDRTAADATGETQTHRTQDRNGRESPHQRASAPPNACTLPGVANAGQACRLAACQVTRNRNA